MVVREVGNMMVKDNNREINELNGQRKEYIINVNLDTMQYRTVSEKNDFFDMPLIGKYDEFFNKVSMGYVHSGDFNKFLKLFSGEMLKKSVQNGSDIISDEIRIRYNDKIYWGNVTAIIYSNNERTSAVISFFDITDKKSRRKNGLYEKISKVYKFVFTVNLEKNTCLVILPNKNISAVKDTYMDFKAFMHDFSLYIEPEKRDFIRQQCTVESIAKSLAEGQTEMYFRFGITNDLGEKSVISMCVARTSGESNVIFLCRKIETVDEIKQINRADIYIDDSLTEFAGKCINYIYSELSNEQCVNNILFEMGKVFTAKYISVFLLEDKYPSAIRPDYFYSVSKQSKGTAKLSGYDYAYEMKRISEELIGNDVLFMPVDDIQKKYPIVGGYMQLNKIKNVLIASVRTSDGKNGIMCIEDFGMDINNIYNSAKLASAFVAFAINRKIIVDKENEIKNIKNRHRNLLNLVYNRMQNGIVQFEVNKQSLKLLNCNEAFCNIIGCSPDIVKKYFADNFMRFAIEEDRRLIEEAVELIASNKRSNTQTEVRILNSNSDIKWAHVNMFHIESNETNNFVIQAEFTDITNLKQEQIEKNIFYETIPGGAVQYVVKNNEFEFVLANDTFYKLFKITNSKQIPDIVNKNGYRELLNSHQDDFMNRKTFKEYIKVEVEDGEEKWLVVSIKCIGTKSGYPLYLFVFIDVTERETAYEELEKVNMELKIRTERYSLIEQSAEEKIMEYDVKEDCFIIQESFNSSENIRKIENYLGKNLDGAFRNIVHPDDINKYIKLMMKLTTQSHKGVVDYRTNFHNDGTFKWYRSYYTNVLDNDGKVVKIITRVKNIEDEKKRQKQLELQVKLDPMTGLLNKMAVKSAISEVLLNSVYDSSNALLLVDIDNFKSVNDNLGHMFGDAVLKNIASAIQRTFRTTDIIGRIGGDEFIVFMRGTSLDDAKKKAGELCKSIKRNYSGNEKSVDVSCSIGIAYSKSDGNDYEILFEKADTAMYASKSNGKNRFTVYCEDMQKTSHELTREDPSSVHDIPNNFDVNIMSFALSLMSNSKDIDSSINILLERIGNKFELSDIVLFECDDCGDIFPSNSWLERESGESIVETFTQENYNMLRFDDRGLFCVNDCGELSQNKFTREIAFDCKLFKSMVAVKFEDNAVLKVFLIIGDRYNVRKWTEVQKNTFYELSRIISVFTALRDERRKDKEKIALLKTTDALTGLYNFEAFKIKSAEIISSKSLQDSCALFYMDINGFAYVNDNFGYNAGDKILCDFAQCIREAIKLSKGGCACRVYSDYFLVLLLSDSRSEVMMQIKNANDRFSEVERKNYPSGNIVVSTGIYFINDNTADITISIDNADLARKKTKRTNQNSYEIYTPDLRLSRSNELSIIGELYRAMEKGKIELFLQPKFSLDTRKVIGAEALARWRNDDCSLKYPSEFVPALEKIGYIVKLDFYMYEQVLKCMRKWLDMGITPIPISVNFSRKNSLEDGFYERVYNLCEAYGIDNKLIEIETTESTFINDIDKMLETMRRFQNAGFKVDIDDFGTGYSSLNMLVSAPVDVVKIDKSFLKNIEQSQFERDYIKQMCKMISTARKDIIFEGVETEEQAQFLLECGFTKAQGYLFDKPIPIDEFERKYIFNNDI